jgi:hypothetical protein
MQVKESAFTPQRQGSFLNLLITIAICAGIGWLVLRACSAVSLPQLTDAKPQATALATAEIRQYCENGKCVKVTMCTAVSDECGSMEQGPKADYGTGFHVSADGRVRPNPPQGWKWAGK